MPDADSTSVAAEEARPAVTVTGKLAEAIDRALDEGADRDEVWRRIYAWTEPWVESATRSRPTGELDVLREALRKASTWLAAGDVAAAASQVHLAERYVLGWDDAMAASDAALASSTTTEAEEEPDIEFAWLIERGQVESQVPTVWWADRKRWGLAYMDDWTEDAFKAFRFESREAAEAIIASKFTPPPSRRGPSARAVEHGFLRAAVRPVEREGPSVKVVRRRVVTGGLDDPADTPLTDGGSR